MDPTEFSKEHQAHPNHARSSLVRNALWNIAQVLTPAVIALLMTPIFLRRLGDDCFGFYLLLSAVIEMLGLSSAGLGEATIRYVAYYHSRSDLGGVHRVVAATLAFYSLSATLTSTLGVVLAPQIVALFAIDKSMQGVAITAFRVACCTFVVSTIAGTFLSVLYGIERFDIATIVSTALSILHSLCAFAILFCGGGLVALVVLGWARSVALLILAAVASRWLVRGIPLCPRLDMLALREVLSFGVFSWTNQIVATLAAHIDRFVLASAFGTSSVAYLSVPKQLLDRGGTLLSSAGSVLFPRFSALDQRQSLSTLFSSGTWTLLCASLVLFVPTAVLMHDLLSLWVGPQFANEATWTAQLIAICFATRGAFPVYMEFLKGTGRIRYLSLAFAGTSLVGVVLAFPLCGYFGLPGAGYRAILLSWAGFAILIAVWTMLLQRRLREIVALIIEPLGVAAALAPFMLWARARVGATSFCGVIGMWIMFAVGLGTALAAVNWAFRRHNGSFARLIGEVLSNRIECRRFAQHEPESSDVGASELHGVQ